MFLFVPGNIARCLSNNRVCKSVQRISAIFLPQTPLQSAFTMQCLCFGMTRLHLRTKWLWVRVPLQSLNLQISRLFWARVHSKRVCNMKRTNTQRNLPFFILNLTSKKLTSFRMVPILIFNPMFLKISLIFVLVLFVSLAVTTS